MTSAYLMRECRALDVVLAARELREAVRQSRLCAEAGDDAAARRWWRTAEQASLRCPGISGPVMQDGYSVITIDDGNGFFPVAWSPVPMREDLPAPRDAEPCDKWACAYCATPCDRSVA